MKDSSINDLLAAIAEGGEQTNKDMRKVVGALELPMQARVLIDMLPCLQRANPFEVGELVVQAKEFQAYNYPEPETGVAIVSSRLAPDFKKYAVSESNNTLPRQDMVILALARHPDGRQRWMEYAVESWRFRKYEGPIA